MLKISILKSTILNHVQQISNRFLLIYRTNTKNIDQNMVIHKHIEIYMSYTVKWKKYKEHRKIDKTETKLAKLSSN